MTADNPAGSEVESQDRYQRGIWLALTLAGLMMTLFLSVLDSTVVGTALPRIVADLDGFDRYSWVVTSYLLTSTMMIPIVSKLSDMFGRRRQLMISVVGFVAGSALCGMAQTMDQLILFRALQGIAGGGLNSLVFSAVADIFSPAERGRWNGLFFGMITLATIAGPPVGGFITEAVGWRWIFYINVPLCLAALVVIGIGFRSGVARRQVTWRQFDFAGGGLLMLAIGTILLGLVAGQDEFDWLSPVPLALFGTGIAAFVAFLWVERRVVEPIVPLHLFRSRVVQVGAACAFLLSVGVVGTALYAPLYIQAVIGDSPAMSGLTMLPYVLMSLVANIITGQVVSRMGRYKPIMRLGTVLLPAGLLGFIVLAQTGDRWIFIACMIVYAVGFSTTAPALNVGTQNAFPPGQMGAGTGMVTLMRSIGQVFGAAVMGAVIIATFRVGLPANLPESAATLPPAVVQELTNPQAFLVREGDAGASPGTLVVDLDDAGMAAVAEINEAVRLTLADSLRWAWGVLLAGALIVFVLVQFFLPDAVLRRGRRGDPVETPPLPKPDGAPGGVVPPPAPGPRTEPA